ncbi:MAG TPA: Gfo/Idh/MocA family oxidoreductase [Pirellulaceae bacterium]|nr:Gfo/Idh/MocA family oxidoreductase [Pirellulaceae bacterium]
MARHDFTRRSFLSTTAATGAALFAAPYFVPSTAFGANDRIRTGHIGVGGQGKGNLNAFKSHAVAVCDVDSTRAAAAAKIVEEAGNDCEVFGDYRQMLDRKDIDAVVITTPDHWHALQTIHACQAGKHVYVEKPLTLFIDEGRKMVEAARKYNVVVQTGSQQRSDDKFRQACELVRSGALGKIKQVRVGLPKSNHPGKPVPDSAPPAELDYAAWLGPAPERPYNKNRVHYNFRFFWDYSGGQMTNFGAHHIDIAQWALGRDESGPIETKVVYAKFHPEMWHEVSESFRLVHTYDDGIELVVGQGEKDCPGGATFVGEKGEMFVTRGKITANPPEILEAERSVKLYESRGHHKNFLDCIASGEKPICDVEIGHRSATVCHLGNIAIRMGQTIQWDPKTEKLVGDAASWQTRPYRSPWELPEQV